RNHARAAEFIRRPQPEDRVISSWLWHGRCNGNGYLESYHDRRLGLQRYSDWAAGQFALFPRADWGMGRAHVRRTRHRRLSSYVLDMAWARIDDAESAAA